MILTLIGAALLGRRHHWSGAVALAAGLILLYQPWAIYDISFQLSFAAVFAIARLGRFEAFPTDEHDLSGTESPWMKARRYVNGLLVASLAAWIGTTPISAYYFQSVSMVAPLANLLVVPLAGFVLVPLGLLYGTLVTFDVDGSTLVGLLETGTGVFLWLVKAFASLPLAGFSVSSPPVWLLALLLVVPFLPVRWPIRIGLWAAAALVALLLPRPPEFEVAMLDVGQGESLMVRLPDRTYLVDAGGLEGFDVGGRVVAPFLLNRGIRKVDAVILTHTHPDHMGGLESLLGRVPVDEVLWNGQASAWLQTIREKHPGLKFRSLSAGESLNGPEFKMEVLHPDHDFLARYAPETRVGQNNDSLVIRLSFGGHNVLFTGDIRAEAETWLAEKRPGHLQAEVLKVPHHGGKGTATEAFLGAVSPRVALISAGAGNRYGHPRPEVLKRIQDVDAQIYRTDESGAILIDKREGKLRVRMDQDFRMKPWATPSDEWSNLLMVLGLTH
jgi:competence protein ComEC